MHCRATAQHIEWKVSYYISCCPRCGKLPKRIPTNLTEKSGIYEFRESLQEESSPFRQKRTNYRNHLYKALWCSKLIVKPVRTLLVWKIQSLSLFDELPVAPRWSESSAKAPRSDHGGAASNRGGSTKASQTLHDAVAAHRYHGCFTGSLRGAFAELLRNFPPIQQAPGATTAP